MTLTPSTPLSTFLDASTATCPACARTLCRGCWVPLDPAEGRIEGECCALGRAIAVLQVRALLRSVRGGGAGLRGRGHLPPVKRLVEE